MPPVGDSPALRAGDEGAFAELAGKYQGVVLSIARGFVPSGAVAEEVVQEAWMGVLRGIGRFDQAHIAGPWPRRSERRPTSCRRASRPSGR
jgi:DNA-directed RNA polymerase specialized sigma24 family protein